MAGRSNLQCFIEAVTPVVPSQKLPADSSSQDPSDSSQPAGGNGSSEFFNLKDLWAQYDEWSAFGVGARLRLQNGASVNQYYVPYLSGLQFYTSTEAPSSSSCAEADTAGSCSNTAAAGGVGNLSFEFFENESPHSRIPFMGKIQELAGTFPDLTAYKSTELSPASWMAVSWYPIYHIPTQGDIKELQVAFLTYHTLSSLSQDESHKSITKDQVSSSSSSTGNNNMKPEPEEKKQSVISLAPFGMATYKLHGSFWTIPGSEDEEKFNALISSAQSWLQQLNVKHPDFNYFNANY